MIRYVYIIILFLHALIHLMGFAKAFSLAELHQLTQHISKNMGVVWLVTSFLLLLASYLIYINHALWWIPLALGTLVSQALVLYFWRDAKVATIINVVSLLVIIYGYADWRFTKKIEQETENFKNAGYQSRVTSTVNISDLPPVVQKWLTGCGAANHRVINMVHLYQAGSMRTNPKNESWLPFTAKQIINTNKPGFIWIPNIHAGLMPLKGRDLYFNGKGEILIKLFSLFTVAADTGTAIDQSALQRYLAELIWTPTAAVNQYIKWQQLDSLSAKATMTYSEVTGSCIFHFTDAGDVISIEADRYYSRKEGATLERWIIECDPTSLREFDGISFYTRSTVKWKLKEGDYTWLKLEIKDVKYNE